jgi:UDP-N-acetyl-D-mannosaminuronate dehydrogenase
MSALATAIARAGSINRTALNIVNQRCKQHPRANPARRYREPDLFLYTEYGRGDRQTPQNRPVVPESTTFPGTTSEVVKPILEGGLLKSLANVTSLISLAPPRAEIARMSYPMQRVRSLCRMF